MFIRNASPTQQLFFSFTIFWLISSSTAQYTEDCGIYYGCFRVPENCRNTDCSFVAKWQDEPNYTTFVLQTNMNSSVFDAWTAIGFSNDQKMGDESVVMCRQSSIAANGGIESYYNYGYNSGIFAASDPMLGLFNQKIEVFGRFFTCRFSRQKDFDLWPKYANLTAPNKFYIFVAAGQTDSFGRPKYHGSQKFFSKYQQNFESLELAGPVIPTTAKPVTTVSIFPTTKPVTTVSIFPTTKPVTTVSIFPTTSRVSSTPNSATIATTSVQISQSIQADQTHEVTSVKKKTHACLEIFTWMFLVATGILLPRYYKYIFKPRQLCGKDVWFVLHVIIMTLVAVINLIAFLVILSELDWRWVSVDRPLEFAHSIFGIFAFGLIYIQIFIGIFHRKPESRYRKVFLVIHRTTGLTAFLFAIVAMFLGVCKPNMNLDRLGWCILTGWLLWLVILVLIIEIIKKTRLGANKRLLAYQLSGTLRENYATVDMYEKIFSGIKSVFLGFHLFIVLGLTISLIALIGVTNNYLW